MVPRTWPSNVIRRPSAAGSSADPDTSVSSRPRDSTTSRSVSVSAGVRAARSRQVTVASSTSTRPAGRWSRSNGGRSSGRSFWPSSLTRPSSRRTTVSAGPTKRTRPATSSPVRKSPHRSRPTLPSRALTIACEPSCSSTRTPRSTTSGPNQRSRASSESYSTRSPVCCSTQACSLAAFSGTRAIARRSAPTASAARISSVARIAAVTRQRRAARPRPAAAFT